jgi:hypothetical protein
MLAKKTSKNQITLPRAIVEQLPAVDYFDVSIRDDQVILKPVVVTVAGEKRRAIQSKIKALGLTERDVEKAIRWARARKPG